MFLRYFQRLQKPSAFYLACHPHVFILPDKLFKNHHAPLFALYERGWPTINLHKEELIILPKLKYFPAANHAEQFVKYSQIRKENIWTVPNILCLGRIILTPYLGNLILNSDFLQAFYIVLIAGFTDIIDGFIARTWSGQSSKLGSFLDPMADKILIITLFTTMSHCHLIPPLLTALIVARDVSLASAGFYIRYMSLSPPITLKKYFNVTNATAQLVPTTISKYNTVVQLLTVAITLTAFTFNYNEHPVVLFSWYLTGVTTLASAVSYMVSKNTYKILKNTSKKKYE